MRLAAIDIGSNAARLLINDIVPDTSASPDFIKVALVRVPLRLGFDVFEKGEISPARSEMLVKTIHAYKLLMEVYGVQHLKACATSAMRDARNADAIIEKIKAETGITIEVISGQDEAAFIYENHVAENMATQESYLYIDVGGGSTELTLFSKNVLVFKESFNIGTIRLLQDKVTEDQWNRMKGFIKNQVRNYQPIVAIGTGGNINKVFSLSKRKEGRPLPLELLRDYYKELSSATVEERMHRYQFRADRADVIVPALQIYISVMRWAGADEINVPKIGLADGLIKMLYGEMRSSKTT